MVGINGIDVWEDPRAAKATIGVVPAESQLFDRLSGEELLEYAGRLHGLPASEARSRATLLLSVLDPAAQFQVTGHQVIGGVPVKVLRATDPGRLTHLKALRALWHEYWLMGQLTSLQVWVDQRHVVRSIAVTSRSHFTGRVQGKPVSRAALHAYLQGKRAAAALERQAVALRKAGKPVPASLTSRLDHQLRLVDGELLQHAYHWRRETSTQVQELTVTFSAIGEPQHITAPRHALSADCVFKQQC